MTGARFSIEMQGMDRVRAVLRRMVKPNLRPLLDALGAEGEAQTRRRIDEEKTAPDGTPWAPLSPAYQARKDKLKPGVGLLEYEGHLRDSLTYNVIGDDEVEWGSNRVYAAIHQFSGEEVGINIPARPYLGLSQENQADMDAIVTDWARGLIT